MTKGRTAVIIIFLLSLAGSAYAQGVMKGKITSVDKPTGKIDITIASVSNEGSVAPTQFKVLNKLVFNSIRPGDRVSFTSENIGGVLTIKNITKE
jgi:Cu/Ag efflux protein CusF